MLDRCPVVPVVVLDDPAHAVPLGEALLAGGIDAVEITLRTAAGLEGLRALAKLEGMLVGAGTVLVPDQVDEVVEAGAGFVVSPGFSARVVDRAAERDVPVLPGVSGATDLMAVVEHGLSEVKLFPAGPLGGPAVVKALASPFSGMRFMPSGGITPDTMGDYLALPPVPAVSGSWMVERTLLAEQRWAEVTARAANAVARARRWREDSGRRTGSRT
ncbi:bifunctional 4-hydroxy-2-oxoglutarate aldolase/2-dehydro-3-deoxy-phosphogluconate aldolase [Amycolatopsis magusensis]|uniref:bifunctional 4-hydroxy-2-oxoglutarate aldolase/2-dehydro-3-deoxy-phosphogluconate aldolase n=1 Tax=Amycolatopsis magusensis TaxID=882444 RepID=UPI0024A92121|nr:bifunctional 4-hydroxy-2-oxoglutarate aldolase/2-dehydro-3-deoxy-phosphogluconate aldolase [Amycolatopsis magusensis]MDI5979238.1 bifunctional 4-hydroxy-2-oxoglutarate aldolase/2-dehydro-3-deoxy-phosphogluconate aldolase [Amycolatopsis magusensis]